MTWVAVVVGLLPLLLLLLVMMMMMLLHAWLPRFDTAPVLHALLVLVLLLQVLLVTRELV